MQVIKNIRDADLAMRQLRAQVSALRNRDLDMKGRQVVNASPARRAGQYATLEQIPTIPDPPPPAKDQFYTMVFDKAGVVSDGESIPAFVVGRGREGTPYEIWLKAGTGPTGGDLIVNVKMFALSRVSGHETELAVNTTLLTDDLHLPVGTTFPVFSSSFLSAVPKFQQHCWVVPTISTANNAQDISIGVVVKRF